jgi:hypothetical protein
MKNEFTYDHDLDFLILSVPYTFSIYDIIIDEVIFVYVCDYHF